MRYLWRAASRSEEPDESPIASPGEGDDIPEASSRCPLYKMTELSEPKVASDGKKVMLVEDHTMFREWLAHLICKKSGLTICGEADNIRDALSIIQKTEPDIVIVDITLKG